MRQIFEHLGLWVQKPSGDPPNQETSHENGEIVNESFDNGWPGFEEPSIILNLCWACLSIEQSIICGHKDYRGGLSIFSPFFGKITETDRKMSNLPHFPPLRWSQNVTSTQKGSMWTKWEKEVEIFLIFLRYCSCGSKKEFPIISLQKPRCLLLKQRFKTFITIQPHIFQLISEE